MKLLLDTHVLLWWLDNPMLLSEEARKAIRNGKNSVYASAASIWEIVIKNALGKLDLPSNIEQMLTVNRFLSLPISITHTLAIQSLPSFHGDPFDRMLIAQALCEDLTLATRDSRILKYPLSCMVA
jgi:PIN domain nuclease of toxin-antitoxin system